MVAVGWLRSNGRGLELTRKLQTIYSRGLVLIFRFYCSLRSVNPIILTVSVNIKCRRED